MATLLEPAELRQAVSRYAGILHTACLPEHHVVSPLGAWLLLALIAPAADGADRDDLARALGADPDRAAATATALLDDLHPDLNAAAAAWFDLGSATDALHAWIRDRGATVAVGDIPDQAAADAWTREGSLGLITRFPLDLTAQRPDALLATVLATRSIWRTPMEQAPAVDLGAGTFADEVAYALRCWNGDVGHRGWIARTDGHEDIGDVVVQRAEAGTGLVVWSGCASAEVAPPAVLAAVHRISTDPGAEVRSLFELELGESDRWVVAEHVEVRPARGSGRAQSIRTVTLPAWSATGDVALLDVPDSGFLPATRTLGRLVGLSAPAMDARQVAVARFHRDGFEAAAVTAAMAGRAMPPGQEDRVRTAELRFPHPYAVVATTTPTHEGVDADSTPAAWDNLPVFSAWVATSEEPAPDAPSDGDR